MQIQLTPNADGHYLSLGGELTLLDVGEMKEALARALDAAQRVVIDTQPLAAIDLAGLQLIYSAHQKALSTGKELILSSRQSEAFRRQVSRSGLIRQHQKDGFWNGGDR